MGAGASLAAIEAIQRGETVLEPPIEANRRGKTVPHEPLIEAVQRQEPVHEPRPYQEDSYSESMSTGPSPIVARVAGPILVTAPHGIRCSRGGLKEGDQVRTHWREKYITELALGLSAEITRQMRYPCSFIVRSPPKMCEPRRQNTPLTDHQVANIKTADPQAPQLDAYYLVERQFSLSPCTPSWSTGSDTAAG